MTHTETIGTAVRRGAVAALACLAVATVPYLYGFFAAPADRVYTGLMFDVPDHAQYWSWVTSSRDGLFIPNTMTPEPNAATPIVPFPCRTRAKLSKSTSSSSEPVRQGSPRRCICRT